MPSDPNVPAQKPTVTMETVPAWAVDIKMGMQDLARHLDRQDVTLGDQKTALQGLANSDTKQSEQMQTFQIRLDGHDRLFVDIRERMDSNSMRAKAASIHDGEQDLKLSDVDKAILDTQAMMKTQQKFFGIDPKTLVEWVRSPNAKRDVATILMLIGIVITTLKELIHK